MLASISDVIDMVKPILRTINHHHRKAEKKEQNEEEKEKLMPLQEKTLVVYPHTQIIQLVYPFGQESAGMLLIK